MTARFLAQTGKSQRADTTTYGWLLGCMDASRMAALKEKALTQQAEVGHLARDSNEHVKQTSQSTACPLQFYPFGPVPEAAFDCLPKYNGPEGPLKFWQRRGLQQEQINRLKNEGNLPPNHLGNLATTQSIGNVPMPTKPFGLVGALTKRELTTLITTFRAKVAEGSGNPMFEAALVAYEEDLAELVKAEQAAMRFFAENSDWIARAIVNEIPGGERAFKAICDLLHGPLHEMAIRALTMISNRPDLSWATRAKEILERMPQP